MSLSSTEIVKSDDCGDHEVPVYDLLQWVRLSIPNDDSNTFIWWPSLLFQRRKDLFKYFRSADAKQKSKLYLDLIRQDPTGKVAYLFGQHPPQNHQAVYISSDNQESRLLDFFDNFDDLERLYGNDVGWRQAYDEANSRLISSLSAVTHRGDYYNSADSTESPVPKNGGGQRDSSQNKCYLDTQDDEKNEKAVLLDCAAREATSDGQAKNDVETMHSDTAGVATLSFAVSSINNDQTSTINISTSLTKDQRKIDQSTDVAVEARRLTPSPKRFTPKTSNKNNQRVCVKRPIPKYAEWNHVWEILTQDYSYSCMKGRGIFDVYYIPPKFKGKSLDYILINGKFERDFFGSEETLQKYVKENFGWTGPLASGKKLSKDSRVRIESTRTVGTERETTITNTSGRRIPDIVLARDLKEANSSEIDSPFSKSSCLLSDQEHLVDDGLLAGAMSTSAEKGSHTITEPSDNNLRKQSKKVTAKARSKDTDESTQSTRYVESKLACKSNHGKSLGSSSSSRSNRLHESGIKVPITSSTKTCSDDEPWVILTDKKAWSRLSSDAYKFRLKNSYYCHPGVIPREPFREGYDYFRDLKSLRQNLCAFGLNDPQKMILSDNMLREWICLANCSQLEGKQEVPDFLPLGTFSQAWSLLMKIGFKYSSSVYSLPNKEKSFTDAFSIWHYLARFGFPTSARPEKLGEMLLSLELFIADFPEDRRQLWNRIPFSDAEEVSESHLLNNCSTGLSDKKQVSSCEKKSMRGTENTPENERIPKQRKLRAIQSVSDRNFEAEVVACSTESHHATTKLLEISAQSYSSPDSKFSLTSDLLRCDNDSLGSFQSTHITSVGDELQRQVHNLSPSCISDSILFLGEGSSSRFARTTNDLLDFFKSSLSRLEDAGSSSVYICGGPGTGKTTMVRYCVERIKSNQNKLAHLFINCANIHSSASILSDLAEMIGEKAIERIGQRLKKMDHHTVLILDEIDLLLRHSTGLIGDATLNDLFTWSSESDYKLILIGISNAIGNRDAKKLIDKFGRNIIFEAYTEEDMTAIVKKRVDSSCRYLIEDSAIKFASKKISKCSGDVRQLLHVVSNAVSNCLVELTPEMYKRQVNDVPIVKLRHVMAALRDSGALQLVSTIIHLPQSCKVVLCVAVSLNQVSPAWNVMTLGKLKFFCAEASRHNILAMESTSIDSYIDIVRQLEDCGLMTIGHSSDQFFKESLLVMDPAQWPLSLQCNIDDVECAVGEMLLCQPFFKQLSEYVRKTDIDNNTY